VFEHLDGRFGDIIKKRVAEASCHELHGAGRRASGTFSHGSGDWIWRKRAVFSPHVTPGTGS
jgi:hypothetical protein